MAHVHNHCKWFVTVLLLVFSQFQGMAADWLCFTAETDDSKFWYDTTFVLYDILEVPTYDPDLWYSVDDGETWTKLSPNEVVTLEKTGDKAYLKGVNPDGFSIYIPSYDRYVNNYAYSTFKMEGRIAASGNILSLLYGDEEPDSEQMLPSYCFYGLFKGCESLTQAPELPSTYLGYDCYSNMFNGCANLREAPALPAQSLRPSCYSAMFANCTSLTKTPKMDFTSVDKYSCASMFFGCTSLVEGPASLPSAGSVGAYEAMFEDCIRLKRAPDLSIGVHTYFSHYNGYSYMFYGCKSLNYMKISISCYCLDLYPSGLSSVIDGVDGEGVLYTECLKAADEAAVPENYDPEAVAYPYLRPSDLVESITPPNFHVVSSPIVIFLNPDSTELKRDTLECGGIPDFGDDEPYLDDDHIFVKWDNELDTLSEPGYYYYIAEYKPLPDLSKCLCFTADEPGVQIWCESHFDNVPDLEYSTDGRHWQPFEVTTTQTPKMLSLSSLNGKIYVRGNNPNGLTVDKRYPTKFNIWGKVSVSGNVMSLIDGEGTSTVIPNDNCFYSLFASCDLTRAPELPATTLTKSCYENMFLGCELLTQAPELPATTMAKNCYSGMFAECLSLTEAPALPATTLADSCYCDMFGYCRALEKAPELPATTLADQCYSIMFSYCDKLTEAPELPATTMKEGCYSFMFTHCGQLTKMPELPAETLAKDCYRNMFADCGRLAQTAQLPATTLADQCYMYMLAGCGKLTKAPSLPATQLAEGCYQGMFSDCVGLEKSPELPATELVPGCYSQMFAGCAKLDTLKVGVLSLDNEFDATLDWVDGVDGPGIFIFPCGSTYDKHGASEVPPLFEIRGRAYAIESTITSELSFTREGVTYTEDTTWTDSLQTFFGCDSVMIYHLKIVEPAPIVVDSPLTACDSFVYQGVVYDGDASWNDTLVVANGADSVIVYHLTIHKSVLKDSIIKAEGSFTRGGITYTESTSWNDTLQTVNGCDSVIRYKLIINDIPTPIPPTDMPLTACDSFVSKGIVYRESATWNDTLTATNGLDSVIVYHLTLHKSILKDSTIMAEGSFTRGGITYTESTSWNDTLQTVNGCDSVIRYKLIINDIPAPIPPTDMPLTACDSFVSKNIVYRESATWNDTLTATNGLDSVIVYHLTLHKSIVKDSTIIAEGSFTRGGITYTESTAWNDTMQTVNGCDSVIRYKLIINDIPAPIPPTDMPLTACDSFVSKNIVYRESATWNDTLTATNGLDSVIVYHLTIHKSVLKDSTIIAEGSFTCGGVTYTESTAWSDTLQTVNGCDSVIKYSLIINNIPTPISPTDMPLTACDSFVSKGIVYRESATWNDTLTAANGLDSVIVYHLTLHKSVLKDSTIIAEGSFTRGGVTYTESTAWNDTLQTVNGCDSVIRYKLIINDIPAPIPPTDMPLTACDFFVHKGIVYHENATWSDTLTSVNGLDSIVVYHMTLHKSTVQDSTITAEGSFTRGGITYTESTAWNDTLQTVNGCDSVIRYKLIINDISAPIPPTDMPLTACDSFVSKGIVYRESATWSDTLTANNGLDSVVVYHLTIHKSIVQDSILTAEGSYALKGVTYTENTSWSDTLQTAFGCDSIVIYHLEIQTIEPASVVVERNLSACDSFLFSGIVYRENASWSDTLQTASGADSIITYHLTLHKGIVQDSTITAEGNYTRGGVIYTESAAWSDTLQTVNGCDSIVNYHLVVTKIPPTFQLMVRDELTFVLPGGSTQVGYALSGGEGATYEVRYNGQILCAGDVANDSTISLNCPSDMTPGAHIAILTMSDAEGYKAETAFSFNVMRPDDKERSFYVKTWNDVVICRNAGGEFVSFQWYKERKKCENATLQYFNDLNLLDGEYMVYVTDKAGKSYFIEPMVYALTESFYTIAAYPNVVSRNTDFTVKVTGVRPADLPNTRIVVYRANGVVERILDGVGQESIMRLNPGEYVIVLTVKDGNSANCKVMVK